MQLIKTKPSMYKENVKHHISDYGLHLVGSTYFNGHPGQPSSTTLSISSSLVDDKGYFHPSQLKDI